jgi:endonuclease/exonuclease/phosphatase family metal-dependent hydrolase
MNMRVLTLNLRHNADRWEERFPLVVEALQTHNPDVIAFQEVWLPIQQAQRIIAELHDTYHLFIAPKQGSASNEGIALATRYPVLQHESLNLPEGERVAQRLTITVNQQTVCVANTHLHHLPQDDESIRLPQMQLLKEWLATIDGPLIVTGDMNAFPESTTISAIRQRLASAYEHVHGKEPEKTFPTPLVAEYFPNAAFTIDYIFFSADSLRVSDARIVAEQPHPVDPTLYPSDHYGLLADFELIPPIAH